MDKFQMIKQKVNFQEFKENNSRTEKSCEIRRILYS